MTLEEAALQLGKSKSTLLNCFPRTQANLKKKGIILTKWGRGEETEYEIEYELKDEEE